MRIGLISDTHGKLRPEARAFLEGCDHIVHAGDVGSPDALVDLEAIAPVTAIRGNIDTGDWAKALPEVRDVTLSGVRLLLLHDIKQLALDPAEQGIRVVVSGHSHKPLSEERDGVLYINPGSAGPRRFSLPVTAGELLLSGPVLTSRIVDLLEPTPSP